MNPILILNGPNLNLLGVRDPSVYGTMSFDDLIQHLVAEGEAMGFEVRSQQSNHEGALIDALHEARGWAKGVVFNAGGYTHTSVALRDAISAIGIPVVEVHISNVAAREEFRQKSMIAPVCVGSVTGFGWHSYLIAMYGLKLRIG